MWHYWGQLQWNVGQQSQTLYLLAAVCNVSAGFALLVAIILEVPGRMVLLIPQAWEKAKSQERKAERARERDILARYGQKDPKTGVITINPEGVEWLLNDSGELS